MAYSETHIEELESDLKKSKYNAAFAQLYRIDDLWKDTHRHSRDILYSKWNEDLDRIWLELVADSGKDDKLKMNKINERLIQLQIFSAGNSLMKQKNPKLYSKVTLLQRQCLMEKEEFLRSLQNKQGKGTAYEDDIEDYMD